MSCGSSLANTAASLFAILTLAGMDGPGQLAEREALNQKGQLALTENRLFDASNHFAAAVRLADTAKVQDATFVTSLKGLAQTSAKRGEWAYAEGYYERVVRIQEKLVGPETLEAATAMIDLAAVVESQGNPDRAALLFRLALEIQEKKLGPNHLEIAQTLFSMTRTRWTKERYGEIESQLKRCLAIREKQLGEDHLDVAQTLGQLGQLLKTQQRDAEAEAIGKRQLAILELRLGPANAETSQIRLSLAQWLAGIGEYSDAETLFNREIELRQDSREPGDEAEVIELRLGVASSYIQQGRHVDAEKLLKSILNDLERNAAPEFFGKKYATQFILASLYHAYGRYAEATKVVESLITEWEQLLPLQFSILKRSDRLADLYAILAELNRAQGKPAEAESLFIHAIMSWADTPRTPVFERRRLAELYIAQRKYLEAEVLLREVLAVEKPMVPDTPAHQAEVKRLLSGVLRIQGECEAEAAELYEQALTALRARPRKGNAIEARRLNAQGDRFFEQRQYTQAEDSYWAALEGYERSVGPDHSDVAQVYDRLARVVRTQGRDQEGNLYVRLATAIRQNADR